MKKFTIGIIAHVDSGKTTLSEAILYKTGVIRKLGRVDHKNSTLDTNEIERERGITIFASQAVFELGDTEFTLIDTPGHIDFSPETERTLRVLDAAILVISGSDGIQSHTETLWKLLEDYSVPTFIFVNKIDISPFSKDELLHELKRGLSDSCIDLSENDSESVAMCSEELMECFLAGEEFPPELIANAVSKRKLFPCCFGSALKGDGIDEFLFTLSKYSKAPNYSERSRFAAKVFKITTDDSVERLTHLKLTGGKLCVKDVVCGKTPLGKEWTEKINSIRIYTGNKFKTANEVSAGTVCAVTGLFETYLGEGLGDEKDCGAAHLEPVLTYRMILPKDVDIHTAFTKLKTLCSEEPTLNIICSENNQLNIKIMGEVQLEVLKRIIPERCGFDVDFENGGIAYRETVKESVIGIGHYEPLRHYAEVQLLIEPSKRGSGLEFSSEVDENKLDLNWQRLILTHLNEKQHIGVLTGSPITDMKITLVAGRAHLKHTEGGDFRQATYRAVRQGLMSAENILLEPWYDLKMQLPSEFVGKAMTDIVQKSGKLDILETTEEYTVLTGIAPVSEMQGYHREFIGYTKGRGKLSCTIRGWEECHNSNEVIQNMGYDPERDTENPADSIFCSHGAGTVVKWNEVPAHKHLDPGIDSNDDEEEVSERVERYLKTVATDAELMAIFEKTYGPIKKRSIEPTKVKSPPKPLPIKRAPRSYSGKEYLLIDGYNIIFAWDELRKLSELSLDIAREELIKRISNYRGYKQCEIIIVFDAYKVKGNHGELETHSGISVVYTKEAETADTYIEKVSHELAKTNKVRVATSDGQEQLIILGNGAIRVSATSLHAEILMAEKEIKEYLS